MSQSFEEGYNYLNLLEDEVGLNYYELEILQSVGIRHPEELVGLVYNFPTLGTAGLDLPKLSNAGLRSSREGVRLAVRQQREGGSIADRIILGARHPSGAPGPPGYHVPLPPMAGGASGRRMGVPLAGRGARGGVPFGGGPLGPIAIDLRLPTWPVRDQGSRGTCVAFALAACGEHISRTQGNAPPSFRLSEQYLYWATKRMTADPVPTVDGTWVQFALDALGTTGTCLETLWPYNPVLDSTNITQESTTEPSQAAHNDASSRAQKLSLFNNSSGGAVAVYDALRRTSCPVAVSLPVFRDPIAARDPLIPAPDNWNTVVGELYGVVIDPPPTSVAVDGHAICITGFVPDSQEPSGGYFVFRNSWGTVDWAHSAPSQPYHTPEPGYGQVSATYVNRFLWEMGSL